MRAMEGKAGCPGVTKVPAKSGGWRGLAGESGGGIRRQASGNVGIELSQIAFEPSCYSCVSILSVFGGFVNVPGIDRKFKRLLEI